MIEKPNALPEKVVLPFLTVNFVPENIGASMTDLAQLPHYVLNYVNGKTAEQYRFFLHFSENQVLANLIKDNKDYDDLTAAALTFDAVEASIAKAMGCLTTDLLRSEAASLHGSFPGTRPAEEEEVTQQANAAKYLRAQHIGALSHTLRFQEKEKSVTFDIAPQVDGLPGVSMGIKLGYGVFFMVSMNNNQNGLKPWQRVAFRNGQLHGDTTIFGNPAKFSVSHRTDKINFLTGDYNQATMETAVRSVIRNQFAILRGIDHADVLGPLTFIKEPEGDQ